MGEIFQSGGQEASSAEEPLRRSPRGEPAESQEESEENVHDSNAWREYELLVDLYKFYLGLVVQTASAYFVIVGGILTLVLANVDDQPIVAWSLAVPVLLSLLGATAGFVARPKVEQLFSAVRQLGDELSVTLPPHIEILRWAAQGSFWMLSLATVLLAILFVTLV
jgi:hypothetical protein